MFATPNNDYMCALIAQHDVKNENGIKPNLLTMVQQNQFEGSAVEYASMHMHIFTELYDMTRIKDIDPDAHKHYTYFLSLIILPK